MTKKITDLEGRLDAAMKRADKKKPAHTPGPWEVAGPMDDAGRIAVRAKSETAWYVAAVAPMAGGGPDTSEANARLIAAAPDLLRSAKALLLSLRSYCATHNPKSIGACCLNREDAAVAIAKAEGRA